MAITQTKRWAEGIRVPGPLAGVSPWEALPAGPEGILVQWFLIAAAYKVTWGGGGAVGAVGAVRGK